MKIDNITTIIVNTWPKTHVRITVKSTHMWMFILITQYTLEIQI